MLSSFPTPGKSDRSPRGVRTEPPFDAADPNDSLPLPAPPPPRAADEPSDEAESGAATAAGPSPPSIRWGRPLLPFLPDLVADHAARMEGGALTADP